MLWKASAPDWQSMHNCGYKIGREDATMDTMVSVGVRELRDGLSKHLALVKDGETVTITEHGKTIARIVPAGPSVIDRLIAEGLVTPAALPKEPARKPVISAMVSDLISEQRR